MEKVIEDNYNITTVCQKCHSIFSYTEKDLKILYQEEAIAKKRCEALMPHLEIGSICRSYNGTYIVCPCCGAVHVVKAPTVVGKNF